MTSTEPVSRVQVLAWTRAGIFLLVASNRAAGMAQHRSIRVMDPATGATKVISRPHKASGSIPVALASDLVTSATPIAGPPPAFSGWDRSHLSFMVFRAWTMHPNGIVLGGVLLVAGAVTVVAWRVRRRRRVTGSVVGG